MKRLILGAVAATAAASAAVLVPQAAGATGGTAGDSISIAPYADYGLSGSTLDLDLQVRCSGNGTVPGTVTGSVSQSPPQTASPFSASAGNTLVVCDGKTHAVAITVDGAGYDAGTATATFTLTNPNTLKTTKKTACITIVAH